MPLTTLPLTSKNPFNDLHGVDKHLPCGDISHYQPLFFPTACRHPDKVLVANLDEGMGTLIHTGSKRNPGFGLWPLSQAFVQAVRKELDRRENNDGEVVEKEEAKENEEGGEMSLSAFLGEGNDDAEWEIVPSPKVTQEKFVLVGKKFVGDVCMVSRAQPEWVDC